MGLFSRNNKNKKTEKNPENQDWNKDLKRNNIVEKIADQQGFDFGENHTYDNDKDTSLPKNGLSYDYEKISSDQVKVLKKCKQENTADELMKILNRTHKTRFKNDILNPLIDCGFFERTIPEKPKSPKQKYRVTGKFAKVRI